MMEWSKDGTAAHRDGDLPAIVTYFQSGQFASQQWVKNGLVHRDGDQPATIYYHDATDENEDPVERIQTLEWVKDGDLHRDNDLPARISYYESGKVEQEEWCQNGKGHRDGNPAIIQYDESGGVVAKMWVLNGDLHRDDDLPAMVVYRSDGQISREVWCQHDNVHRDGDRPAEIKYYDTRLYDGLEGPQVSIQAWARDGEPYRDNGLPEAMEYSENGQLQAERWFSRHRAGCELPAAILYEKSKKCVIWKNEDGEIHRDFDLPAVIIYDEAGRVGIEQWSVKGRVHREGGQPAVIRYRENGQIRYERWSINGNTHREGDLPAEIRYHMTKDGSRKVKAEYYYTMDELHRDGDQPAAISYYKSGRTYQEGWYQCGKGRHREGDLPAAIRYYDSDNSPIKYIAWQLHGNMYQRPGGAPSIIHYDTSGKVQHELWPEDAGYVRIAVPPADDNAATDNTDDGTENILLAWCHAD